MGGTGMKRALGRITTALLFFAVASLVWAQVASEATLKTPGGDRQISIVQQGAHTFVAADEVVGALGGTIAADASGFRISLNGSDAALGPDSRFAVVRDDLIEMPTPPLVIEGRAFVPWQFFRGLLPVTSELDAQWDHATKSLLIRPMPREIVHAQISVVDLQEISKMVVQLSTKIEHTLTREGDRFTLRFRRPIRPPFAEQTYDSPHIARILANENEIQIQTTAIDIGAESYRLESPFRIVLDFRKGVGGPAPAPGVSPTPTRPIDLPGIRTIVLDPGHGGKEVGAIGPNGLLEKDTTLAICQKLADRLSERLRARVILTRTDDSVVAHEERTSIANRYKADLFLSVHLNASLFRGAHGTETYFLSLDASDEQAKKVAERENLSSSGAEVIAPSSSSDLKLILWDLAQQENLKESSRFAEIIQDEMNSTMNTAGRGVKQAPFKVLIGATMPAALVEVGFISNPDEEAKLRSEEFQNSIADALVRAVERFKAEYETRLGIGAPTAPAAKKAPAATNASSSTSGQ